VVGADGSSSPPLSPPRAPLSEGGQNEGAKEKKGEQKEQEEQINSGVRQEGKDETKNAKYRDGKEGQSGLSAEEREQKGHPKNEGRSDEEEKSEGKEGKEEETEEEREKRTEQRADVDRHMAKLYIMVLQAKHQERSRSGGGEFSRVPTGDTDDEKEDGFLSGFASLGIGELPMCDPSAVPGDFESVRDVFKKAKVGRAWQFLVLLSVRGWGVCGTAGKGALPHHCRCFGGGDICFFCHIGLATGRALFFRSPWVLLGHWPAYPIPFLTNFKLSVGRSKVFLNPNAETVPRACQVFFSPKSS